MVRQLGGFRGVNCELQIEENVEEVEPAIYRRLETAKRKTRDARWDAYQVAQGDRMDQHTTHLLAITRSLQLCQRDIKFLELRLCKSLCSRATRRRFPSSREDSAGAPATQSLLLCRVEWSVGLSAMPRPVSNCGNPAIVKERSAEKIDWQPLVSLNSSKKIQKPRTKTHSRTLAAGRIPCSVCVGRPRLVWEVPS
jgi:hypothetical protein